MGEGGRAHRLATTRSKKRAGHVRGKGWGRSSRVGRLRTSVESLERGLGAPMTVAVTGSLAGRGFTNTAFPR